MFAPSSTARSRVGNENKAGMRTFFSRIRQPVKREHAEWYVLTMLLSFAASVIVTRLYLELAGYPQIGGGGLHIAHVLWGGLLLFVASLLPLVLANRDVLILAGVLSGIGVGLFIDEVGKFITSNNNYFYPAAAPIIYAFFLLTVLIYLRVRRPPARSPRAELYRALDGLAEVLEHDLEPNERRVLEERLRRVTRQQGQPELARLAQALLEFLVADEILLAEDEPRFWQRWRARLQAFERRRLARARLRVLLALGMIISALPEWDLLLAMIETARSGELGQVLLVITGAGVSMPAEWVVGRLVLTTISRLLLLAGAVLLLLRSERRGIALSYVSLLFSLTVGNLITFYIEQFSAVADTLFQLALLLGALHYRHRYVDEKRAPRTGDRVMSNE
jgi:hypothetical protein